MLVWRIGFESTYNPLIDIFFYPRHLYCIYIVRRNSVFVNPLTPMGDQDRISPSNINTMCQPDKG